MNNLKPLIKYIGNKHRVANEIISYFPPTYGTYFEPFLGSGAVLGHVCPKRAVAGDINKSLIEMWQMVKTSPYTLSNIYREHIEYSNGSDKKAYYEKIKARFNTTPNPNDFLFITRACYGGVIRFRKDGYLSTPVGVHTPIRWDEFASRIERWHHIVHNTEFRHADFSTIVDLAGEGDVVYCDPPYVDSQAILYGAQKFSLECLFASLLRAKQRGSYVIVSVDGTKKSGARLIPICPPEGLFETEVFIALGGSMLKRFSRDGLNVWNEKVTDRLLLSYVPENRMLI